MYVISVDVGSGSVRAAISEFIDSNHGRTLITETKDITIFNPSPEYFEQKSSEIWDAVCYCIQTCIKKTNLSTKNISGIGFDATCSLVIVEDNNTGQNDVIMWMDHRALEEAHLINKTNHAVLQQFGGKCSPEFSIAKVLWLRRHENERFGAAAAFMELPDWLTWKCLQDKDFKKFPRSFCSLACKWGYNSEENKWPEDLLISLGLEKIVSESYKFGESGICPGEFVGSLSSEVAIEFGLENHCDTSVSSSIIDAHSGGLAMMTLYSNIMKKQGVSHESILSSCFAMIAGTSTCHFSIDKIRSYTKGVWGPYYQAIYPGYYVREAGQSATGLLIHAIVQNNIEFKSKYSNYNSINDVIKELNHIINQRDERYKNSLHLNPCFHGNRSPLAEPGLKGGMYGLLLNGTKLEDLYAATIEALAYETKFIIQEMKLNEMTTLLVSGGLTKNELYMQIHANVLNCQVIEIKSGEADMMLVGAAILGRQASLKSDLSPEHLESITYSDIQFKNFEPQHDYAEYHEKKYLCYKEMMESALKIEKIMEMNLS